MTFSFDTIRNELTTNLDAFEREVKTIYDTLVIPHWGGELHGFPHTLRGYMMNCFAHIDLFSAYWKGDTQSKNQTRRMIDFMQRYMSYDREASNVAVQIWRHKLMHTGEPRPVVEKDAGTVYKWLLHWWKELPPEQHFTFSEAPDGKNLNTGLVYLIGDLKKGLEEYLADLSGDPQLQENFERVEAELKSGKFRLY